jgi:hypothetical protein
MATVTKKQVVAALHKEDYAKAKRLGKAALRHLKVIVQGDDLALATKATYLAGMISAEGSAAIVDLAARSRKRTLRVAAAGAAGYLAPEAAEPLLSKLLNSADVGVRKCAIRSVETASTDKLRTRLDRLSKVDKEVALRKVSRAALKKVR